MSSTSNVAASSTGSTNHLNRRSLQASEDRFLPQEMLFDALLQWTPTSPAEVDTSDPLSDAPSASDKSPSSDDDAAIPVDDSSRSDEAEAEGEQDPSSQWNSLCCESLPVPSLAPPPQTKEQNGKLPSDEKMADQQAPPTVPVRPIVDAVDRGSSQTDAKPKSEVETLNFSATQRQRDTAALGSPSPSVLSNQPNVLRSSIRPDSHIRKRNGEHEPNVKSSMATPLAVETKRTVESNKSNGPNQFDEVKREMDAVEQSDDKPNMDRVPKSKRETHLDRVRQDGRFEQDPSYKAPGDESSEHESLTQQASKSEVEGSILSTTPSDSSPTITAPIPATTVLENRPQSHLPLSNQERGLHGKGRGSESPTANLEIGSSAQRGFISTPATRETRSSSSSLSPQQEVRLVQRVLRGFEQLANGDGQVKLRLHPPQLGSLQMTLRVEGSQMSAKLEVENALARDALIDNLPQLRQKLSEQGVNIETFEVTIVQSAEDPTPSDSPNYDPWSGNTDSNSGQYSNAREERREPSPWENSQLRRQSPPRLGESIPSHSRVSQGLDVTA